MERLGPRDWPDGIGSFSVARTLVIGDVVRNLARAAFLV
jgi:hypothetical protein